MGITFINSSYILPTTAIDGFSDCDSEFLPHHQEIIADTFCTLLVSVELAERSISTRHRFTTRSRSTMLGEERLSGLALM
jgi:hypothetical protein